MMTIIKYDMNIPGYMVDIQLRMLANHVHHNVPVNGNILELGACMGRTTVALAENCHPSVTIHTVDFWGDLTGFHVDDLRRSLIRTGSFVAGDWKKLVVEKLVPPRGYDPKIYRPAEWVLKGDDVHAIWQNNTSRYKNVIGYRDNTQLIDTEQFPDFDFILVDASHDYAGVETELNRWWPKLKSGGTMMIDDYDPQRFPAQYSAVNDFFIDRDVEKIDRRQQLLIKKP